VALEAMHDTWTCSVIEYSHSAGYRELPQRAWPAYYAQPRHRRDARKQIIVTNGGSEALLFAMMSCLDPGRRSDHPRAVLRQLQQLRHHRWRNAWCPCAATMADGFALPSKMRVRSPDHTQAPKAILICNPGNPTGYLYSRAELETLRGIVLKHDLFLFADEVYREFCYDGATHVSALELDGLDQHAILIDSVSKRYSMCGARVGAFITRNAELLATALKFAQARLSPPTFGQIASEAALRTPQQYFADVVAEYVQRRDILVDGLNRIPGVSCPMPKWRLLLRGPNCPSTIQRRSSANGCWRISSTRDAP
jgi:aspartate aminotransferase